jgi:hypothetical protein
MANPFGGSDQALSKNTGHANQANLLFAMIPRSTTKWREVVNAADVTVGAGNYDADGYWRAGSSTRVDVGYTIGSPLAPAATLTVIAGIKYNAAGDVSVSYGHVAGLWDDSNLFTRFHIQCDRYNRDARGHISDNGGVSTALTSSWYNPGNDVSAFAVKRSGGNVNALYRVGSTTTQAGSDTGVSTVDAWDDLDLDRVGVRAGTKWAHQYVFVYNAALSDADIAAIIDDPGAVISQAGGGPNALAGSATAGATASATLSVQRNLATTAVATALASGSLSINKALSAAAIGQAVGVAALQVFSQVWRAPTNAPNGTAVIATVYAGIGGARTIITQGLAVVAGGYVDIPGGGTAGAKALMHVDNYNDNTATTSIRGGPAIATLTSI